MKKIIALIGLLTLFATQVFAQDLRYTPVRFSAWNSSTTGIGTTTLDAANDWIEEVFYVQEPGTLSSLCSYFSSETGTGPTYKIGWEGVSLTTGEADGVYKTGTGECSCTVATDTLSAGWKCCTPTGTTCTVTRGELGAITTKHSSGTIDGSNFAVWGRSNSGSFNDSTILSPNNAYSVANTTGTGTAGSGTKSNEAPIFMYKFTGRTFGRPFTNAGSLNYNSDSASDEYGNKFRFDCPTGQTYTTNGVEWWGQTASAAKSVIFRLYAGTAATPGAVLHSATWDADVEQSSAGSNRGFTLPWDEAVLEELDCGTDYFVTAQVQETSSNFGLRYFDVGANSDLDAYPGGINTYSVNRADSTGAFTEVNTRRVGIDIVLDDIQDAAGGGGGGGGGTVSIMTRTITKDEATAAERRIPLYLVDVTDGLTEETGLTISGSECRISKNGASAANCAGTVVENENGLYYYQASLADVDTIGDLTVHIEDAAARVGIGVANITGFDLTSTAPNVNVFSASDRALENSDFAPLGTAQAAGAQTLTLAAAAAYGDNALARGTAVHIAAATLGAGQTRCIASNVGATDVVTLAKPWTITPTGTIEYTLIPQANCDAIQPIVAGRDIAVEATTGSLTSVEDVLGDVAGNVGGNVAGDLGGDVLGNVAGDVAGNLDGTIGGLTAGALKDFFDTNSTATFGTAVAGSVVKELGDNAGPDITIHTGTAQAIPSASSIQLAAGETYGNNVLANHASILILTSSGATGAVGQVRCVKSNVSSTDTVTLYQGWQVTPAGTVTYAVIPTPNCFPPSVPR